MRSRRSPAVAFTFAACLAAAGCTGGGSQPAAPQPSVQDAAQEVGAALPHGDEPVRLDPADLTTRIDNPFWPMRPGTRWTYREIDEEGTKLTVVVIVTRETKRIADGVTARVVRDTVSEDGDIVEDTMDWYAQDRAGNIWYLGEDTAEFEDGRLVTREGSFEAGVDGALPGIAIPANPAAGMRYRQEYYAGQAEDRGEVLSTDEMAQVPSGLYRDALLTKDTNALEPKVLEYKLYARGVGPVLTLGVSGGAGREELLQVDRVPPTAGTGPLGNP